MMDESSTTAAPAAPFEVDGLVEQRIRTWTSATNCSASWPTNGSGGRF